jgi:regulator of protease activity HflC (stomatin/prohibitin superfamily)
MERTPFFRRSLWTFLLGLLGFLLPYSLFYLRATPANLPGSLLGLIPLLGLCTAVGALSLSVGLVLQTSRTARSSLPMLMRLVLITTWVLFHVFFLTEDPRYLFLRVLIFDLDLLILALILSLSLAAQFVLPVESARDRLLAIRRLLGYALGERGPVTFVQEGVAREAYAEDQRPGPGVFLIDSTSAVVLRTDTAFTRAVGPGVVFTNPGERRAEALDLRRQVRRVTARSASGPDQASEADVTSDAETQDGIPVSADISIAFILDPGHEGSPREGRLADKPPYDFNPASVERAVYAHTFGELGDVPWTHIPGLLVADLWREEIKQWSLSDLLRREPNQEHPLDQIRQALHTRFIPPSPKEFQTGEADRRPSSREREILAARGIRILDISIADITLPKPIQDERMLRWQEAWSGEVQTALQEAIETVKTTRDEGEREAEMILARELGKNLLEELRANKRINRRDTLLSLVADVSRLASSEATPEIDPHLRSKLTALQDVLRNLPADCHDSGN